MAISDIDVDQLADRLRTAARLVDVRESDEYERGHVPGALSIPLATVPDRLDVFRGAEGPVYVICQSGGRSRHACEFVAANGIDAVNVEGGTGAWIASGRETVSGDRP